MLMIVDCEVDGYNVGGRGAVVVAAAVTVATVVSATAVSMVTNDERGKRNTLVYISSQRPGMPISTKTSHSHRARASRPSDILLLSSCNLKLR